MIDINARQGRRKIRMPLDAFRRQDWVKEIEQPEVVYHMTDRENLESILNDGKIKSFNDFLTFFFSKPLDVITYIHISGALVGRAYTSTDGRVIVAPPLDISNTVVLKLTPRRKEMLEWYREIAQGQSKFQTLAGNEKEIYDAFNDSRIVHYRDFQFRNDDYEVIELSDIYKNLSDADKDFIRKIESLVLDENVIKKAKEMNKKLYTIDDVLNEKL